MSTDPRFHLLPLAEVIDETADARSFVLEVPDALAPAFAYSAGQFVTCRATVAGEAVARCYSMSSSPDVGDRFTVTVKRVAGGKLSNWLIDTLAAGDRIEVSPPAGRFVLHASEAPIVAFAGGSGITPILSIVKTALATSSREIALVYANRDAQSIIFARELERLREASRGRLTLHHHLDSERGFLDAAACAALVGERAHAEFYLCGPGPFMQTVEAGLALRGVPRSRIFMERFELPDAGLAAGETSQTETVVIRFDRRKHRIAYTAGDTILETARRANLKPPFACQAGSCATCMAHLDEGRVSMRVNDALTPEEVEAGWVLTCQSLPLTREVVVDYDR